MYITNIVKIGFKLPEDAEQHESFVSLNDIDKADTIASSTTGITYTYRRNFIASGKVEED